MDECGEFWNIMDEKYEFFKLEMCGDLLEFNRSGCVEANDVVELTEEELDKIVRMLESGGDKKKSVVIGWKMWSGFGFDAFGVRWDAVKDIIVPRVLD